MNFINKMLFLIAVLGLMFIANKAQAAELPKEMELKTDVGAITLTIEPCPITASPYEHKAYATENIAGTGVKLHKGCWAKTGPQVNILFYEEPQQPFIATYADYYFKPKPGM
jgi:hypothetical protein